MSVSNQRYLQVSKVARILDCRTDFVRQLIHDKKLEAINLSERATRISVASLENFIKQQKVDPNKYYE
jgi:excisionase family DNA binding protein